LHPPLRDFCRGRLTVRGVRRRPYGGEQHRAVQRAATEIVPRPACEPRVQGDHLPARRRQSLHRGFFMSPTGKGTDSPCIPRCVISAAVGCLSGAYADDRMGESSAGRHNAPQPRLCRVLRANRGCREIISLPAGGRSSRSLCGVPHGGGTQKDAPAHSTGAPADCIITRGVRFSFWGPAPVCRQRRGLLQG